MSQPLDPEDVTQLQPADLAEVAVDETPDDTPPLEADPADAAEQRAEVDFDDADDADDDAP